MRALLALVRAELVRLLRSPEVMRFVVLPGAFVVPLGVMVGMAAGGVAESGPRLGVPAGLPLDLSAGPAADVRVVPVSDPVAAWDDGAVDVAVVAVEPGAGPGMPGEPGGAMRVTLVGSSGVHLADARRHIRTAERQADRMLWTLQDTERPRLRWTVESLPTDAPPRAEDDDQTGELLLALLVLLAVFPGPMLLPILGAQERESGVAEQLATAPPTARTRLLARLLGFLALVGGVGGLVLLNLFLPIVLMLPAGVLPGLGTAGLEGVARAAGAVAVGGSAAMLLGELAPDVSRAMNLGGLVTYAALALLGGGLLGGVEWLPLASLVLAEAGWPLALAVGGHLVLAALLLEIAAFAHARNVSEDR